MTARGACGKFPLAKKTNDNNKTSHVLCRPRSSSQISAGAGTWLFSELSVMAEHSPAVVDDGKAFVDAALEACESPIERIFIGHLLKSAARCNCKLTLFVGTDAFSAGAADATSELQVYPQWNHSSYRCDFKLVSFYDKRTRTIIVECDGHDYHERTKEQAANDRARDRALLAAGFTTMRFTGSEVWNRGEQCAAECMAALFRG